MVVCNTSMIQMAPACPPPPMHPYPPGLCSLTPISAMTCKYPILPAMPPPGLPEPPMLRCNTSLSSRSSTSSNASSPDSSVSMCNVLTSNNGVLTSNLVPCTTTGLVPISNGLPQFVPISQGGLTSTILHFSPKGTSSPLVQCNQEIYSPNTTFVPSNQRIVSNGANILQCQPRVCQLTPTGMLPSGAVEMCPIPPTPMMPNSPDVFPMIPLPPNLCAATPASSWKQSYGMEQVWQNEFRSLFSNYAPHVWMLLPVVQKPIGLWSANVDSAKVRFCCEDCGHGWTSMKGRVAFWFVLNPTTGEGLVCLKLYGQQCDRCKTGNYEPAMWYPEEVLKVLVNIYNRVGQVYYGFQQAPYHKARRAGKPRTPHNSDLCQACKDGVCSERR